MLSGFDGEFDLLPVRAGFDLGPVPMYPTDGDFQLAGCMVADADPFTWAGAAVHWQIEAIRERRLRPACTFDEATLKAISKRVASRLARAQKESLSL